MKPCIKRHDPRPAYVHALIGSPAHRHALADLLGLDERTLRNYGNGFTEMPYPVQFMIEASVGISAVRRARKEAGKP
jgi:hypothetical protein